MEITVNQIKGACCGAILGEILARYDDDYSQQIITEITPSLIIALTGMKSIINSYQLEQKSWLIHLGNDYPDYLKYKGNLNLAETAIALSPIIIYRYENATQLELDLPQAIKLWLKPELNPENLTLWTLLISKICEQKIDLSTDFFTIINYNKTRLQNLEEEINLIQGNIINQASLNSVEKELNLQISPEAIAIYQGIYCFLSLPDDFYLSLQRSSKINHQQKLTTILTGFLLGLNNGYFAIPSEYRNYLKSQSIYLQIEQISRNFWQTWRGEYCPEIKAEI